MYCSTYPQELGGSQVVVVGLNLATLCVANEDLVFGCVQYAIDPEVCTHAGVFFVRYQHIRRAKSG